MTSLFDLHLVLLFFILFYSTHEQTFNTYDYDAYGTRFAMNEYFAVLACNDYKQFNLIFAPYSATSCTQSIPYSPMSQEYVYTVAIAPKAAIGQFQFTIIGEYLDVSTSPPVMRPYFGSFSVSGCPGSISGTRWFLNQGHQETFVLGIDPYGLVAWIIDPTLVMIANLNAGSVSGVSFPNSIYSSFALRSIVVDQNQTAHIAGYACTGVLTCQLILFRIWFDPNTGYFYDDNAIVGTQQLPLGNLFTSYARASDLSLDINYDLQQLLLGVPYLDTVFVYNYSSGIVSPSHNYDFVASFIYNQLGVGFGKSVAWLDNNTIAILAYSLSTLPWSTSQVQFHHLDDLIRANGSVPQPYFAYPNNQQVLIGTPTNPLPTTLLLLVPWSSNNLAILSDARDVWFIPASSPGFCSSQPLNVNPLPDMKIYANQACISGTEKNQSTCGPCFVCPTNTKNNGSSSIQCIPCSNNSFCPLGSTSDLMDESTTSVTQANPYPESPESTNFDDILLSRVFSFGSTMHCLFISPLFWASIMMGFTSFIVIIMAALTFCPKFHKHRQVLKHVLSRMDLVREGELWIGGLVSLAIIVLVIFAYIFSASFLNLYPIEKITNDGALFSCDPTMHNAKFTSTLQFLAIAKLEEEQPIFDMLDSQPFTLTVEFVNTGFNCNSLTMQQNTGSKSPSVLWTSFNCSTKSNNAILVVSTALSDHEMTLQYNLTGPYFIGGIRVCFSGDSSTDGSYTLQQLNFCQFFSTFNQTLASAPDMTVEMAKVINRTAGLDSNGPVQYSGLWLPTLTLQPSSDKLLYSQQGDYTRYLIYQTVLVIDVSETNFYIKNTQEPIAKQTEIMFHTILFTTLCIEIFGLLFLIVKLTIAPLIRLIQHRLLKMKNEVGVFPLETEEKREQMRKESFELKEISIINEPPIPVTTMSINTAKPISLW